MLFSGQEEEGLRKVSMFYEEESFGEINQT